MNLREQSRKQLEDYWHTKIEYYLFHTVIPKCYIAILHKLKDMMECVPCQTLWLICLQSDISSVFWNIWFVKKKRKKKAFNVSLARVFFQLILDMETGKWADTKQSMFFIRKMSHYNRIYNLLILKQHKQKPSHSIVFSCPRVSQRPKNSQR